MSARFALFATVSLHDVVVDEVRVPAGQAATFGREGALHLPVPDDAPYVAAVRWDGAGRVIATDGRGETWVLGPDDDLSIGLGPVRLDLRVARQFALRRTTPVSWQGSLAWFLTVFAATLVVMQVGLISEKRCAWFGIGCPVDTAAPSPDMEFIARLLKDDLEGSDESNSSVADARSRDRVTVQPPEVRDATDVGDLVLEAGDPTGPMEEEGGAKEVAATPVRTPPKPRPETQPSEAEQDDPLPPLQTVADSPTELPPPPEEPEDGDGVVDVAEGVDTDEPDDEAPAPPPAEEREGFGMADWLDMTVEERRIQLMLRVARERLRIDPEDLEALSVLAYYQYLAEDLPAAEATYDRMIELQPESAATYNNKALIFKRRAEYQKEEGLYRVALALEPDDTTAMNNLAVNLSHQGKHEEALAYMDRLEVLLPDDPYSDLHRAKIHADMGETDQALRYLDLALAGMEALDTLHHIEFRQDIRVDPSFRTLRDDPRFRAILEKYYGADAPVGGGQP